MQGRVLLFEADAALRAELTGRLEGAWHVVPCASASAALEGLDEADPDVVLADIDAGTEALDACRRMAAMRPAVPVLVATAHGSVDLAVAAIRAGAFDFLVKPLGDDALQIALDRAMAHRSLRLEVRRLRREASRTPSFEDLVGDSPAMRRLFRVLERVAATPSSVLIQGESGTGKELVARALHRRSPRRDHPFVALNCAALPEQLLESELFGHTRGAFTDARGAREGLLVKANRGTLFLDEIGDMPAGLQSKLLRVLQERTVRPVGSDQEIPVDVRVVAATHRDLEALVEAGTFREDLLYRLDVIRLEIPPLRDRGTDVLLLAQRFVEHHARRAGREITGLTPEGARKLLDYDWPGNVRELQNCIERAVVLTEHDQLTVDDLPARIRKHRPTSTVLASADDPAALLPMHEVERRYILQVLEAVGGNKATAARILELDRKTLYRKLQRYGHGGG